MQPLRIVMAGCGRMSRAWLEAAREIDGAEMVGFVDIDSQAARARAEEFGGAESIIGTEIEAVLQQTAPDVVFDCTVPEAHVNITLAALARGCHVLGEKPLADSMDNARRMVASAQAAGKVYAVIQNRRYDPNIRRLRGFIEAGALGQVTTLHSDFFIAPHFGGFRDQMEHVLLLDMAIHTFDAARYISGADPVSVYCREWNPAGSWYDHDASAVAVFEMSNGLVYTYRGSWCAEGLPTTWESDWRVIGTRGSAGWRGDAQMQAQVVTQTGDFFSQHAEAHIPTEINGAKTGGHRGLIHDFIDCLRTGRTPETICTDNIKSLAMVFGAIESAETGKSVQIKW